MSTDKPTTDNRPITGADIEALRRAILIGFLSLDSVVGAGVFYLLIGKS
ncbi:MULTISPECIES: hypothetical protein [unclassified Streptomyces]